jgi:hypothetical protein
MQAKSFRSSKYNIAGYVVPTMEIASILLGGIIRKGYEYGQR